MNAYELADELENKPLAYGDCIQDWLLDAANMLRQQADRIAELEKNFDALNAKHTKLITQQSAEPVAWMHKTYFSNGLYEDDLVWSKIDENSIPLYTAPQPHPAKTLTDDEYEKLMQQWDFWRKQIADGDKSSAPRDWFESTIDYLLEQY